MNPALRRISGKKCPAYVYAYNQLDRRSPLPFGSYPGEEALLLLLLRGSVNTGGRLKSHDDRAPLPASPVRVSYNSATQRRPLTDCSACALMEISF